MLADSNAFTSCQPEKIVTTLNAGFLKAVDAAAPSTPQRLGARDYFFFPTKS